MRLCLYISIGLSIYGPIHVSIYLRITFSTRPSIYLSKDLLACKHSATSVSFVLDVSRFNSTLSSPRPSWSASVGQCLHLSRTGLTTATTKAPTTGKRLRHTTCNTKTFQKCLQTMRFTIVPENKKAAGNRGSDSVKQPAQELVKAPTNGCGTKSIYYRMLLQGVCSYNLSMLLAKSNENGGGHCQQKGFASSGS